MEIKNPILEDFQFEQMYHVFTRVSGNELIFRNDKNYIFFLEKISKYLLSYAEIYAYCLVPKRFSLLICFRSQKEIFKKLNITEIEMNEEQIHKFLMQPISNMLNSYAKSYNKIYQRKGALFVDYIKREKIDDEEKLLKVFQSIHQIPIQNRMVENLDDWKFSSYKSYIETNKPSKISRSFMLSFFETQNDFINFHKKLLNPKNLIGFQNL